MHKRHIGAETTIARGLYKEDIHRNSITQKGIVTRTDATRYAANLAGISGPEATSTVGLNFRMQLHLLDLFFGL